MVAIINIPSCSEGKGKLLPYSLDKRVAKLLEVDIAGGPLSYLRKVHIRALTYIESQREDTLNQNIFPFCL